MPWISTAVAAAAAIGGGVLSSNASNKASNTQAASADQANALQKYMYDTTRADQAPYRAAGVGALGQLSAALGISQPSGGGGAGGGNVLANASGMPTGTGNLTPGMIAANAASGTRGGAGTSLGAIVVGGILGARKNNSPIQDISQALKLGRTITDAQWAQAGFGPGGADRNAPPLTLPTIPIAQGNPTIAPPGTNGPAPTPQDTAATTFQASPGYQFAFDQGQKAVDQGMGAAGMRKSGARDQAQIQFGQGIANQEYGNWMNGLRSLAGIGQVATGQGQQANQNYATQAGNTLQTAAAARASGYVGSANAWSGVGNQLAQLAGTYQQGNNNYNPAMGGNYQGNYLAPFNSSAAAQGF